MSKQKTIPKLNREEKDQFHKKEFDPMNQAIISSDQDMRKMKSLQYQLLAAVFLGKPLDKNKKDGDKFEVKAIIDSLAHLHPDVIENLYPEYRAKRLKDLEEKSGKKPDAYSGDHHFSNFPQEYKDELTNCLRYVNYGLYGGNAQKLAASLANWDGKLIAAIKNIKTDISEEEKNKQIIALITNDKIVQLIRGKCGFDKAVEIETKTDSPIAPEKPKKELTPEELEKVNLKLAQELFIDAQVQEICGNDEEASRLYEKAEDLGYSKKVKKPQDAIKLSPENHSRNLTFAYTYLFYKTKFKDTNKAQQYCKKMAEQGIASAQTIIGSNYYLSALKNSQDTQSFKKAIEYFEPAKNQGYALAQYILGFMHRYGQGVKENLSKAAELFKLAADQGLADAQFNLALMYHYGRGVGQNSSEAVRFYKLAADQGYAEAQHSLGVMYKNGDGVVKNLQEAERYYKLAADQNFPTSQTNLALMHLRGEVINKDLKEAERLLKSAADQNLTAAKVNLANLYLSGTVEKNTQLVISLLTSCLKENDVSAQFSLGVLYKKGTEVSQDYTLARKFLSDAVAQNYADAQFELGEMYELGKGMNPDLKEAERLYRLSVAQDCTMGQKALSYLLYKKAENSKPGSKQDEIYEESYRLLVSISKKENVNGLLGNSKLPNHDLEIMRQEYKKAADRIKAKEEQTQKPSSSTTPASSKNMGAPKGFTKNQ